MGSQPPSPCVWSIPDAQTVGKPGAWNLYKRELIKPVWKSLLEGVGRHLSANWFDYVKTVTKSSGKFALKLIRYDRKLRANHEELGPEVQDEPDPFRHAH